jgi:nicotinate dehydrogenase subunit B
VASVQVVVNGESRQLPLQPPRSLLTVLRAELGLTGAKPGCGEGVCGACTVLLDGEPVCACQVTLAEAAGRSVTTVEGLAQGGRLHPVQRAFAELGALQCGYCTPGMVLAAAALLARRPAPSEAEIRKALEGHLCRCCAYPRILRAVRRAAELGRLQAAAWPAEASPPPQEVEWPRPARPWDRTPPAERRYFDVLPEGLVVTLDDGAQGDGAWLHVGADGLVTAFAGKVEVGQDVITALSLLVAEELRVPLPAVRLVLGDTDLCPFDPGTFGSRSMPEVGPRLQALAAAARLCLVRLAAERWGLDAGALVAEDGRVRRAEPGFPPLTYGELVRGLRRAEVVSGQAPTTPPPAWRLAGTAVPPCHGVAAVTGARRFPSDLRRPGMLYGKVLRPPALGAVLRSADLSGARAFPGVVVVHEGGWVGVAAPHPTTAAAALEAIRAEWEVPPQPGEAELVDHLRVHPAEARGWERPVQQETGDVDSALAAAPVRLEATYTTAYLAHVPLETRAALAEWEGDRLTVWTGTQRPFAVRAELAQALGMPEERIRVIVPPTGSGYGGRHTGQAAVEAARLARAAGRPVQVTWTRAEEFTQGYFRPAAVIDVRCGALADGTLTAWEFSNLNAGAAGLACPYDVPHQRLTFRPAASPLPQGSYRALAATANTFARESHLDELAWRVGADPLELRLRHLRDARLVAVLRAAAERAGWARRPRGPGRGMGIACGVEKGGRVATVVEVAAGEGGTGRVELVRIVTAFECGAVVHPEGLRNQVEGATVMGLGGALFEAVRFEAGRILNASLGQYRVPRMSDVPPIEMVLLDRRDLPPAGGGETPILAVAPALANALRAATGRRLYRLPLEPDLGQPVVARVGEGAAVATGG